MGRLLPDGPTEIGPPIDAQLAALAARQHGVVARRQLRALGLRDTAITERAAAGRLHRVHRGVYAVGHIVLTPRGRCMAAVLAGGPDTVLSHKHAAAHWQLMPDPGGWIHVSRARREGRRRRHGFVVHRLKALQEDEVTEEGGIPITTVARTLLDLAEVVPRRALERAADQAEALRLFDLGAIADVARLRLGAELLRDPRDRIGDHRPRERGDERVLALVERVRLQRLRDLLLRERVLAIDEHDVVRAGRAPARERGLEVRVLAHVDEDGDDLVVPVVLL
jgi:hypothetical protein